MNKFKFQELIPKPNGVKSEELSPKIGMDTEIKQALLSLYREMASEFNFPPGVLVRDFQRHRHTIGLVHRFAPRETHRHVLDIAAGWAIPSRLLLKEGYEVHLTDSYAIGGQPICDYNRNIFPLTRIDDLDRDKLPFSTGSFDAVLWLGTIEHLQNSPKRILTWIYRILRPGGVVLIDTPNILELRKRIMLLLGRSIMPQVKFIYDAPRHADHHLEYTKRDLEYVVRKSGFTVAYSEEVDTISAITIERRMKRADRKETESQYNQMTQFIPGFDAGNIYSYMKLPFSLLVKLVPSLRDALFIVGFKDEGRREALSAIDRTT